MLLTEPLLDSTEEWRYEICGFTDQLTVLLHVVLIAVVHDIFRSSVTTGNNSAQRRSLHRTSCMALGPAPLIN
jgi:hypothetical protein